MRVLVVSDLWLPFPGGAERLMFNIARHLYSSGIRGLSVQVVTGYGPAESFDGPPVRPLPIGVGKDHTAGAAMLLDAIRYFEPDVLLVHHFYAREFEAELVGTGIPIVQVVENGYRIPSAALAVFISEYVRSQALAQPHDLTITPPAFDDVVSPTHGDAIGFIKPLPHKGAEMFYAIAAHMARRFVVLRGEWRDLEDIRHLPNVEFMDPVRDIRDFYSRCRVVLVPSVSEDAGTVAQECALNGIPCISSAVGGLIETNAGGILIQRFHGRLSWQAAIRQLDNPDNYRAVVNRQREYLASVDHAGQLDRLAEAMKVLALGAKPR